MANHAAVVFADNAHAHSVRTSQTGTGRTAGGRVGGRGGGARDNFRHFAAAPGAKTVFLKIIPAALAAGSGFKNMGTVRALHNISPWQAKCRIYDILINVIEYGDFVKRVKARLTSAGGYG
jgi:hypothetical protein